MKLYTISYVSKLNVILKILQDVCMLETVIRYMFMFILKYCVLIYLLADRMHTYNDINFNLVFVLPSSYISYLVNDNTIMFLNTNIFFIIYYICHLSVTHCVLPNILNGYFYTCSGETGDLISVGESCIFLCNCGYVPMDVITTFTCTASGIDIDLATACQGIEIL